MYEIIDEINFKNCLGIYTCPNNFNIAMHNNSRKVVHDAQRITSKTGYNYIGISIPDEDQKWCAISNY